MGRSRANRSGNGQQPRQPSQQQQPRPSRAHFLPVDPFDPDREEALADVLNEAARMMHTLDRVGGTLSVSPVRGPAPPSPILGDIGEYATVGFLFRWDSYAPGLDVVPADELPDAEPDELPDAEPEPEPEVEPDDVETVEAQ